VVTDGERLAQITSRAYPNAARPPWGQLWGQLLFLIKNISLKIKYMNQKCGTGPGHQILTRKHPTSKLVNPVQRWVLFFLTNALSSG
ncbi:MAG: hypothetical protein KDK04_13315, partial [Candidatus Competibacteraceae bacterium]|nr:hypothetical protein [Candidatus Competibacteraceae bacterium]